MWLVSVDKGISDEASWVETSEHRKFELETPQKSKPPFYEMLVYFARFIVLYHVGEAQATCLLTCSYSSFLYVFI